MKHHAGNCPCAVCLSVPALHGGHPVLRAGARPRSLCSTQHPQGHAAVAAPSLGASTNQRNGERARSAWGREPQGLVAALGAICKQNLCYCQVLILPSLSVCAGTGYLQTAQPSEAAGKLRGELHVYLQHFCAKQKEEGTYMDTIKAIKALEVPTQGSPLAQPGAALPFSAAALPVPASTALASPGPFCVPSVCICGTSEWP